jgi:long-subunit fatty acid transport protein
MKRRAARVLGIGIAVASLAGAVAGQDFVIQPPGFTLTLPNYGMTPIGQVAGLEGGAFVARANDASSNWYNPAGLALAQKSSISSSAGTYQSFSLIPEELTNDDSGGSSQTVPALVGVVVKDLFRDDQWTAGFAAVRTNSFEQETDAQIFDLDTTGHILDYSANATYRRNEYSFGVGYTCARAWRFGATLAVANTSLSAVGSILDERVRPGGLDAGLVSRRASGSITQLRLAAGAQYQLTPEILLGAIARSPGLDLFRSGEFSYDALGHLGGQTASLSFFDPDPRFDYQLPFQASIGAAIEKDRFQLEVDVNFATGGSPYDLFTSERSATLIYDDGSGNPPIVTPVPFEDVIAENEFVVNVAVGGSYALTKNKVWTLHFGFNTDFSPVGEADNYFSHVDLYGLTAGVSGSVQGFTAAVGFNYQFGNADNVPLADILDSDIEVKSWAIIYSVAYRF